MDDLISRKELLESIEKVSVKGNVLDDDWVYRFVQEFPSAQSEPLTDNEQRIFLAAMLREKKICMQVDDEYRDCREPHEDSLVSICHEIIRKVKGALWMI